jgi:hypothetical protein
MNVRAGPSRGVLDSAQQPSCLTTRYIMTRTDFGGRQFPDDEDRDGPRNVGLLATQTPDADASPGIFY